MAKIWRYLTRTCYASMATDEAVKTVKLSRFELVRLIYYVIS